MHTKRTLKIVLTLLLIIGHCRLVWAQNDTLKGSKLDSFILNNKGVVGKLARNLLADTSEGTGELQRNDRTFRRYRGRIIRSIIIKPLPFGVSIGDTTKIINNRLTRLANHLHKQTRLSEISENLFFKQHDTLSPSLLGDNERYLRELPYLQDARLKIQAVKGTRDSVDVIVLTKDVISIGGGFEVHNINRAAVTLKEDNFYGLGDRYQIQILYDQRRQQHLGYGFEYIKRNIKGSFIDGMAGYLNFAKAFNSGRPEERLAYFRLVKPLVNPYVRWTYALEAKYSSSQNMYAADTFYTLNLRYKSYSTDAWTAWNTEAGHSIGKKDENRLRIVTSIRFISQRFTERPLKYLNKYNYQYSNLDALLGSISIFQQNSYKVAYLYRFGRPEDIPQGTEATLTYGLTVNSSRRRPYMAADFQRYYFNAVNQYFNFSLKAGSYFYRHRFEDINLFAGLNFFNHLYSIGSRWKQRTFLRAEIAKQFNGLLNEPVFASKLYGLSTLDNELVGGNLRAGINGESVFYSPWSLLYFRIAPFVFGDMSLFRFDKDQAAQKDLYTAVGGGIRFRNESLIFQTMELRGWYFPKKNYYNEQTKFEFKTKVGFTYNQRFIKRPEFIQVN
jgi:hypothetical protein